MKQKNTILSAIALTLTLTGASAARAEVLWSAVGAAGSVDDASMSQFDTRRAGIFVKNEAPMPAIVTVRYSITPTDAMNGATASLAAYLFDNGDSGSVSIQLYEVALDSPQTGPAAQPRLTIASDRDNMESAGVLLRGDTACANAVAFDFEHNAYYITVNLIRRGSDGQPGLHSIQLDRCN